MRLDFWNRTEPTCLSRVTQANILDRLRSDQHLPIIALLESAVMKAAKPRIKVRADRPPQIVQALQGLLNELSGKKRQAAEYFLAHPDQVAFMSLRKICLAARVSTGIVMKLLGDLGCQSYESFKSEFQQWVTGRYHYFGATAEAVASDATARNSLLERIADNDIENVRRTAASSTAASVRLTAETIIRARRVFVIGMRVTACIALYLAYQLNFIRDNIVLLNSTNDMLVDQIADIGSEDVLIATSFFPYTSTTVAVVEHAFRQGATVVALTDRENSPIVQEGGIALLFAVESPWVFNSITASLMLAQAIVAETLVMAGKGALARINERDRLLNSFTVFEK